MRFWDASAILPLVVQEGRSGDIQALARTDSDMVIWWGTPVECASAVERRVREGSLDQVTAAQVAADLNRLFGSCNEVIPTDQVRGLAVQLLARRSLKAADALQLAAALTWSTSSGSRQEFVTLDVQLGSAAAGEGLTVVPATP